ncbi:MAG TPA: hypothetical protein VFS43_19500 [Polyangiaceae bacterium]|nr:hypothetical protein [Polyangiaceae bacterium]
MAAPAHARPHAPAHGSACDCAAHRPRPPAPSLWGALLPALACAVCPACVATYAKLLSLAGVGLGLSERQHALLLAAAIAGSVATSAFRAWRARRAWPLAVALVGAALILAGHRLGEAAWLEWSGVLVLLAGGLIEQVRLRRLAAPHRAHT